MMAQFMLYVVFEWQRRGIIESGGNSFEWGRAYILSARIMGYDFISGG